MLKKTSLLILLFSTAWQLQNAQTPIDKGLAAINKNALQSQLTFLSSDWFEGRETATRGANMAGDYLASLFQHSGLQPAGDDSTYFQQVPLVIFTQPSEASLKLTTTNLTRTFKYGEDFNLASSPISYSTSGSIIWAGYGIDEMANKKSTGKILLRLQGLPANTTKELKALKPLDVLNLKTKSAVDAGVAAILEYDPTDPYLITQSPANQSTNPEKPASGIYSRRYLLPDELKMDIPVVKITKSVMQQLLPNLDEQLEAYLEKGTVPSIIATANIESKANTNNRNCRNVIARIQGSELPEEIIVVGAHYDHLGSYDGFIWNGADDNASGAIGVAAIAAAFKATGIQPKRTVIFATWTAEERGLLGSRYFVKHFDKIGKVICYHNYDMIGRSYDPKKSDMAVSLMYSKTWPKAELLSDRFNKEHNLGLNIHFSPWDNPTSGSDNAFFAKRDIPIMWYHTGGHSEYHKPSDHAEHIDWQKLEAIIENSFLTLWELANE
ncbi:MAG: M20/M25/M40 family metallo-hydrolase [Breznakibacter sp.]|nr:M20/M25/M40 family metallo-hydrolase [Breznakibacter sp.]